MDNTLRREVVVELFGKVFTTIVGTESFDLVACLKLDGSFVLKERFKALRLVSE